MKGLYFIFANDLFDVEPFLIQVDDKYLQGAIFK